jgi:CDP-paratose synthetase
MTGASGYLGRRMVPALLREGHELTLLVRTPLHFVSRQVSQLIISPHQNTGRLAARDHDVTIHCATNYGRFGASADEISWVNYEWPAELALGLAEGGMFLHIDTALPDSVSTYAAQKGKLRKFLTGQNNLRSCNVRLEHYYGAGDGHFLSAVTSALLSQQATLSLTSGIQKRDFIWIDDAVEGILVILKGLVRGGIPQEISLGSGIARSIRSVVEELSELCGPPRTQLEFGALPLRAGEPMESRADLLELTKMTWRPNVPWESGIQKFVTESKRLWESYKTLQWRGDLQF